jgi:F-type H+-transporting ATPase subunit alpha
VADVGRYETGLVAHLRSNNSELLNDITNNDRKVKGELEDSIKAALDTFSKDFV